MGDMQIRDLRLQDWLFHCEQADRVCEKCVAKWVWPVIFKQTTECPVKDWDLFADLIRELKWGY